MIKKLKRSISPYYRNLLGWKTNRKIIVIESDDWGSIRMPSREVYQKCLKAGYRVDENPYERFDSLASEDDLELLFDALTSEKDHKGNYPLITANVLVANPDFEKIKQSQYQEYYYESIIDTFGRYPNHKQCFRLWKEGIDKKIFYPQSHGREHLNVLQFMLALNEGDDDVHFAFSNEMPGIVPKENNNKKGNKNKYVESLHFTDCDDKKDKLSIIIDGILQFKSLFGYPSKSFIPTNYMWSPDFNEEMSKHGVFYLQGRNKMIEPNKKGGFEIHSYSMGKKNQFNQLNLIRNASFEPSLNNSNLDPIDECLRQISIAFKLKKPAIISSHRVNYVGYIDPKNRDLNLKKLKSLLTQIVKKWPQVEFLNTVQLGDLILYGNDESI